MIDAVGVKPEKRSVIMPVMEKERIVLPRKAINASYSISGKKGRAAPDNAVVSKGGVIYYPFTSDEEAGEWMDNVISEWWDDETV